MSASPAALVWLPKYVKRSTHGHSKSSPWHCTTLWSLENRLAGSTKGVGQARHPPLDPDSMSRCTVGSVADTGPEIRGNCNQNAMYRCRIQHLTRSEPRFGITDVLFNQPRRNVSGRDGSGGQAHSDMTDNELELPPKCPRDTVDHAQGHDQEPALATEQARQLEGTTQPFAWRSRDVKMGKKA